MAQGEYVAPEKIENVLTKNPIICQAFVHGHSLRAFPVAVIVPDEQALMDWARKKKIAGTFTEICRLPETKEMMMAEIAKLGRYGTDELKGFEIPENIWVESTLFSITNGLLTATFKLKRFEAKTYYAEKIGELYSEVKE